MSIREIEAAITKLSPRELAELAAWFADYHEQRWDEQIGRDLDAGRLDAFLAQAEAEYEGGTLKPLGRPTHFQASSGALPHGVGARPRSRPERRRS